MNGAELLVRVDDLNVGGAGDTLLTVGLGSCVAIVLHDAQACVAPQPARPKPTRGLPARKAVPTRRAR